MGRHAGATESTLSHPLHLTNGERAVLDVILSGMKNEQAAEALCVSRRTIEFHIRNIYARLGVHNRVQLANVIAASKKKVETAASAENTRLTYARLFLREMLRCGALSEDVLLRRAEAAAVDHSALYTVAPEIVRRVKAPGRCLWQLNDYAQERVQA